MDPEEALRQVSIAAGYHKGKITGLGVLVKLVEDVMNHNLPIAELVKKFDARFPSLEELQQGIHIRPIRPAQ